MIKDLLAGAGLALLLAVTPGCATVGKDFTACTEASYAGETTGIKYSSCKNQENFKAEATIDPVSGKLTGLKIETTASTPEAAIAAASQANARAAAVLEKLIDRIPNK